MKTRNTVIFALVTMMSVPMYAHASCSSAALWAAENAYGNDPIRTRTETVINGKEYKVTVGIGNDEDGAHTYRVTFKDGSCDPRSAQVCDLTQPGSNGSAGCPNE